MKSKGAAKKKPIYNKTKKKVPVHIHSGVLSSCDHCTEPNHDHIKGIGNSHRFHKTKLNKHPFCYTHFSLNNPDVRLYCADQPYWKKLRTQKIKQGTLKPSRRRF